MKVKNPNSKKR